MPDSTGSFAYQATFVSFEDCQLGFIQTPVGRTLKYLPDFMVTTIPSVWTRLTSSPKSVCLAITLNRFWKSDAVISPRSFPFRPRRPLPPPTRCRPLEGRHLRGTPPRSRPTRGWRREGRPPRRTPLEGRHLRGT